MNTKHILVAAALIPLLTFSQVPMAFAKTASKASQHKTTVTHVTKKHKKGTVAGTIENISSAGFTVNAGKRGNYDVTVSSSTQYKSKDNSVQSLSDIQNGDKVRVKGTVDKKAKTVTNVSLVIKSVAQDSSGSGSSPSDNNGGLWFLQ